jgi:hypothetical protein
LEEKRMAKPGSIDWGGKVAAWFIGVAGVSAALAALIVTKPTKPLHGSAHFWFVTLAVIAIGSLAALLLIGLRRAGTLAHAKKATLT